MSDYKITAKVQNGLLWKKMEEAGLKNASELARLAGVLPSQVGDFLNLKCSPYDSRARVRAPFRKICESLGCDAEDIYPIRHINVPLHNNIATKYCNFEDINRSLIESENDPYLEVERDQIKNLLHDALGCLSKKQNFVIKKMYGIGCREISSFVEMADEMGLSVKRVGEIHGSAISRLYDERRARKVRNMMKL